MKKVMLGVLVVIPIIIMLIVGLVTSFVSTQAYIGVESVSMDRDTVQIFWSDVEEDANGRYIVNLNDYINVTVLPERATNKTVEWQIQGDIEVTTSGVPGVELVEASDDGYTAVDTNTTGLLEITGYCTFRVSVNAEGYLDTCLVEVTDSDVQSITLSGENELSTGEKTMLTAAYNPAGSMVTEGRWESDNPSVATVDANGVVTAVGEGSAVIYMCATQNGTGEEVRSEGFTVTVKAGASLFGSTVYTAERRVDLAAAGVADAAAATGGVIEDGVLVIDDGASSATVSSPAGDVTFVVCGADDFVIANADFFAYDPDSEDTYTLGIGEIPLDLDAEWLADIGAQDEAPSATWSSSDESVATVDENGVVTAVSKGEVTITATVAGVSKEIRLFAVEKISIFRLQLDESSLAVGLARETVFASYRFDPTHELTEDDYDRGTEFYVDNVLEIALSLPVVPEEADDRAEFYDAFVFETDRPELASFEGNVLVFNADAISERTDITISVSARYPRNPSLAAQTLTITVIPAVEVNDVNEFFVAARSTQTFTKLFDGLSHRYDPNTPAFDGDIVLGSDIAYCDTETGEPLLTALDVTAEKYQYNNYEAQICCSLYGNNHRIYASQSFMTEYNCCLVTVREEGAVVSNVTISPNNDVGDEIQAASDAQGIKGYAIQFRTVSYDDEYVNDNLTACRLEYSIIQNAGTGIGLHGVDFTIDGCIVRNMGGTGIYVPTNMEDKESAHDEDGDGIEGDVKYSILRTHNLVMSNLIGTGMSFHYVNFSNNDYKKQFADQKAAAGQVSTLIQTGFLDIYNWQSTDALSLIDKDSIDDTAAALIEPAMALLRTALENQKFAYLIKDYDGTSYVHFGFVSTGLSEKSYLNPSFEDERFVELSTDMFREIGGSGVILGMLPNPIRVWCYTASEGDIVPGATYTVNTRFIDRLHQD
ncbi:MAG TPA: Ig-like domain-containing protein [Candidatus Limadaptatus stercorigallinarum]|uniref:Ig-like domain-containing protein n=1 Tax=Candidatus Limadaptatus stercorigallinarum TaxID=2840845 RepID=A0A9D1HSN8_9FIRM|nr:Ig-like domain-containing protein [Candidatus Limadaptatus stercorigallinarum]